ncbi:protein containing DUF488 [mine drainage metagenome]|jgi:uncharacterized protein YeaO (DUF488 family)|uniref:Protein containing DUF488 n=2 Tax=root TaxID=1 RepID=T0YGK1_9ZZZZ
MHCIALMERAMTRISIQRVYAAAAPGEGVRILVDRLWPRGLSKDKAAVRHWLREVAPSDALRHWFAHDPARWDEFQQRYFAELDAQPEAVRELRSVLAGHPHVTLLYAARDVVHNNAVALLSYLRRHGTAA